MHKAMSNRGSLRSRSLCILEVTGDPLDNVI
jgi:hypothetical protein